MDHLDQCESPYSHETLSTHCPFQPLFYGFESLLTNEFHTIDGSCSKLVPSGDGYEGVSLANQVCTTVGSLPGQETVNGNRFVQVSYGYSYSHLWRNFGIVVSLTVAFLIVLMVLSEFNTSSATETAVTLYKRKSRKHISAEVVGADEEKGQAKEEGSSTRSEPSEQKEKALENTPTMTDVFSWQDICYTVSLGKGEKALLLDNVSGFVVPGRLTALMYVGRPFYSRKY